MKIAYITNGFYSNLNCSYELCRRLAAAGHEVTYLSAEDIGRRVSENGYPFIRLTDESAINASLESISPALPLSPRWFSHRRQIRCLTVQMFDAGELVRAIERIQADLLMIDIELHFAVLVCLKLRIPIVLTMVWFTIFYDEMLPPMHTTLFPPRTAEEKALLDRLWKKENTVKRKRRIKRELRHLLRDFMSPGRVSLQTLDTALLRSAARHHGMDLDDLVDYTQWLRPMVFKNIPILAFNVYEMDFPHAGHESLHYVGPMVCEQRIDPPGDEDSIRQWRALREKYPLRQTGRSLVYCSLGTFWKTDQAFLASVIGLFERRPDWHLVIGLGGKLTADAFPPLPDNVTVLKWAPQLKILMLADCAITHGGITTINECVYHGVPMLVYSTAHGDQNGCAARVAWHGLGIMGDRALDDTDRIEMHIESLIRDPRYKSKIEIMRGHFSDAARSNRAVRLIEQAVMTSMNNG